VPITFTRIVRTGLSRTVSTPAIAAQWTMCVAPAAASRSELEPRMLQEAGTGDRVAVEIVVRDDRVPVDELPRESRADEARAAGDQDPLALQHPANISLHRALPRSAAAARRVPSRA
jgi:hypothetical protein